MPLASESLVIKPLCVRIHDSLISIYVRALGGGARDGAGRKKHGDRREPPHRARREVRRYNPIHVVLRVRAEIPRLRTPTMFVAIRDVLQPFVDDDASFRICHISIQANHLHLLIEAENKSATSRGMRALNTALSKAINRQIGRDGAVFAFRYHDTHITSPRQARNALLYVLNNWRHDREDRCHPGVDIDPYSSGYSFDGWRERVDAPSFPPLPVSASRSWLFRTGWRRHGLLSFEEVPAGER